MTDIVLVCEYATLNGGEQSLLAALDQRPDRLHVEVIAPPSGRFIDELQRRRIEHIPIDLHDARGHRRPAAEARDLLTRTIRHAAPRLVHANSLSMSRLLGSLRDDLDIPCTGHVRDIIKLSRAAIDDLNRLDTLIAVSRATRDCHVSQGLDHRRVVVLHNGVDCARFHPGPRTGWLHRELGLDRTARLLVTIGQIGPRKGQALLIEALASRHHQWPAAHLLIIGERYSTKAENVAYEQRLHQRVHDAVLDGRVHWLGYRGDLDRLLSEVDLLVHPARQEPLGRVLLEGLASGLPIVATDVGGTGEIVDDGVSGLLIPPDDVDAIGLAIGRLLHDADARQRLSAAARQTALTRFAITDRARDLYALWAARIGGEPPETHVG